MNNLLKTAVVVKPHGIKGEVKVKLLHKLKGLDNIEAFFILRNGQPVPFFIQTIKQLSPDSIIVGFEDFENHEEVQELKGEMLFLHEKHIVEEEVEQESIKDILGYALNHPKLGFVGIVSDVFEYPGQVLVEVKLDSNNVLIPLAKENVKSLSHIDKSITLDFLEELLEL